MHPPKYTFRSAKESDFDFLYTLMKVTMKEHVVATWGQWDEEFQIEYFKKKFDPLKNKIIIVNQNDAGAIMLNENSNNIQIDRLFLLPEYQGKGIGSSIITHYIDQAKEKGKSLSLTVIKTNTRALRFYKRLGFEIVSEDNERYTLRIP